MKNLKSILFSLLAMMAVAVFMTSCERESIIEEDVERWRLSSLLAEYPEEITIDNWEEFVYAPQEVIDYHQKKEMTNNVSKIEREEAPSEILSKTQYGPFEVGFVKAFNSSSSWDCLSNVTVTRNGCSGISWSDCLALSGVEHDVNYFFTCLSGQICMDYQAGWLNGVTTFDIVLIQRHLLNIQPFTEARQVLAADINGDEAINASDLIELRKLVLGITDGLPNRQSVTFLPDYIYEALDQDVSSSIEVILSFINFPNCTWSENRYAIKTGDIDGSFNF